MPMGQIRFLIGALAILPKQQQLGIQGNLVLYPIMIADGSDVTLVREIPVAFQPD